MSIDTFQLVKERCVFSHLNVRTEQHGEEREPACDLKFEFSGANNLLSKLHPDLRDSLYKADDNKDIDSDHKPHLRFPMLGTLPYGLEIPRTLLRIHDTDDPSNDVVLGGGKTNNFKITPKEGGTVEWSFRCQFSKPDEDSIAKLMRALNQSVPVSLECADEEKKPDNFEQAEQAGQEPHSEARKKADSLFDKPAVGSEPIGAATPDDVVNAEFTPEEEERVAKTNVAPITRAKRGSGKRASNGAVE